MKGEEVHQNHSRYSPEAVRQRLREAEVYLGHGLFDEAKEIYQSLLSHYQTKAQKDAALTRDQREVDLARSRFLQKKIEEVDRLSAEFYGRTEPEERRPSEDAVADAESIFNTGIALKEIGLYEEAVDEFKRAAKLRYRLSECLEEIGSTLVLTGAFQRGIKTLRRTLRLKGITTPQKISMLEKIASAYEAANDKKKAQEIYREILAIDKSHREAALKIKGLAYELKRIRPSLATVCDHPRIFLIASLLFASIFFAFVPFLKTVDNVDYFTLENDPDVVFYNKFKKVFGNDEFFVVAFKKENIFTEENLELLKSITEDLESSEEIREIRSLANVDVTVGEPDYFKVRKFLENIPEDKGQLETLRKQAINNSLYVKNLISPDGQTVAILISTYNKPEDEGYRKRLISKTRKILDRYRDKVEKFYLAGWTTTNLSLSQYMKRDIATFIPVTYLLITLTVLLFFRSLRLTLLAVANISICMGSTMGLFALTGITLNNVTTIVPPLVMALALCDTVHIFSHMEKRILAEFPDKHKALASVLRKVFVPCFFTTLTTAVGFLSLAVSEIPPIREFAWLASAGMVFEFVYSFFFLPPLILLFPPETVYKDYTSPRGMTQLLGLLNDLVQKHSRIIVIAAGLVVLVACWFMGQLRVETNILEYFKKSDPVRTSIDFVEQNLSGVGTLEISLQAKEMDAFKDPANLKVIERVQQYVKSLKGVDVAISFVDFIKDMNESFHDENPDFHKIPDTREMVSQYLLLYDSNEIEDFINSSYDHARISVRTSKHASTEQAKLIREIKLFLDKMHETGLDIRITGRVLEEVNVNDALVKSQVYSLLLAAGVIIIVMFFVLRSLSLGLLSLLPNVFPIILNFGIMGAIGIPLNAATAMIAAVAIGIAVDDTIHFLSEYRIRRTQGISIRKSLKIVIFLKGRAIISSSLIVCIGFGVLVLSSFVPTMNFGLLSAIIMVTALIGDIVILPSIILLNPKAHRAEPMA